MSVRSKAQTQYSATKAHHFDGPLSPLFVFAGQTVLIAFGLALVALWILPSALWALAAFFAASAAAGWGLANRYPYDVLGLCNTVTLFRVALVALLFGILFAPDAVPVWLVFCIGVIAFAMDGLDGWLARRSGLQSDFGARFDMETDAALGATLALWLMLSGTTQAEVLILGFARYAFVVAGWALPQLRRDLPPSFRRKVICVVQIAALLILVCPLTPVVLIAPLSIGASIALCYSFGVDIHWLLRRAS